MTSTPQSKLLTFFHPNHLTVFRLIVGSIVPFLILAPGLMSHGLALLLFILGALSDYWDGWIARRYNLISDFGKWMDPLADKVLVLGCLWAFSRGDHIIPAWIFGLIFARECIVTFCRTGWILEGQVLGAEKAGKWKLFAQTILLFGAFAVLLLKDGVLPIRSDSVIYAWSETFVAWFSFGVIVLTWYSGLSFLIVNRALSGTFFFAKYVLAAGVGLLPKAPGTWGSLLAVALIALTQSRISYWLAFFVFSVVAYYFYEKHKESLGKDPQFFVIDEICGIYVTFALCALSWKSALLGFALFRLFDIWKPFPIRRIEKLPGYWGIMADDLLAGLYAAVILYIVGFR